MSIECMTLVSVCYSEQSLSEWALAMQLANCADRDGTSIFPSVDTMGEMARQDPRTAKRNLRRMVETGWLLIVAPATHCRPTEYRINPEWIQTAHEAQARRTRGGKRKQVNALIPMPSEAEIRAHAAAVEEGDADRGDTVTPPENDTDRGDTVTPPAGVTPATSRGDIGDTAYIGDPPLTLSPLIPQGGSEGFDALCKAYPARRVNYSAALRRWREINPDQALQAIMVREAATQARWPEWVANRGQHVPKLSGWLLNRGWLASMQDEAPAAQTAAIKDQGAPAPRLTPEQLQENGRRAREEVAKARALMQARTAQGKRA